MPLFKLVTDIGERPDLLKEEPKFAKELLARLRDWQKQVDAMMPPENMTK